jgi:hypothetical protein
MGKFKDYTGVKFGRLEVIRRHHQTKSGGWLWECKCDCGNTTFVSIGNLRSGDIKSCGCLLKEICKTNNLRHGFWGTHLASVRNGFIQRCYNAKDKGYKNWGGRGITVCDEWRTNAASFYNWALSSGYKQGLSLDRINNDGPYSPENCRWATQKEQCNNRRNSKLLTLNGVSQSPALWAKELKVNVATIYSRIYQNWTDEEILTIPITGKKERKRMR